MQRYPGIFWCIVMICGALLLAQLPAAASTPVNFEGPCASGFINLTIMDMLGSQASEVHGSYIQDGMERWTLTGSYFPRSRKLRLKRFERNVIRESIDGFYDNGRITLVVGPARYTLEPASRRGTPPDDRPSAAMNLPGKITILHTEQLLWPAVLTLTSRDGSIGHYDGRSVQGYPLTATAQLLTDGSVTIQVECKTNGFSGTYRGKRQGNVVEGQYTASSGFGGGYFKATFE